MKFCRVFLKIKFLKIAAQSLYIVKGWFMPFGVELVMSY